MVGWFPDRRGFAAGVVAAGYGMGAMVTTFPISDTLASAGWQAALLRYGVIFGVDRRARRPGPALGRRVPTVDRSVGAGADDRHDAPHAACSG